jgi:MFS transporter, SHS family, lactate transporter
MSYLNALKELTPNQRNVVVATFLGWTLDSFDFFIIVFVFKDIAKEFNTDIPSVTATLFLTLAMRPLGTETSRLEADRVDLAKELLALELRGVAALTDR